MKRWLAGGLFLLFLGGTQETEGKINERGTPFFVHYPAELYRAHDRNEDVVCDVKGNCYFANLEGILKYDGESWELITTPGISRITALTVGMDGRVYVGGYHVAGVLNENEEGKTSFQPFWPDAGESVRKIGEVEVIRAEENRVVYVTHRYLLIVEQDTIYEIARIEEEQEAHYNAVCDIGGGRELAGDRNGLWVCRDGQKTKVILSALPPDIYVNDIIKTETGQIVVATATHGVFFLDRDLQLEGIVDEARGLCSNVVNGLADDGLGSLWLATDKGVVRLLYASMYTAFTEKEGLPGEVLTMLRCNGKLYVGTYRGLFCLNREKGVFQPVSEISQACWQMVVDEAGSLWAAASDGVFRIQGSSATSVSNYFTMCVSVKGSLYSGEQEGLYRNRWHGGHWVRQEQFAWGQVNQIMEVDTGNIWVSTISGEVGKLVKTDSGKYIRTFRGLKNNSGNRICSYQKGVMVISGDGFYREAGEDSLALYSFLKDSVENGYWPGLYVEDPEGGGWLTRGDGKKVIKLEGSYVQQEYSSRLKAVEEYAIRVIYPEQEGIVWLGGSFGLIRAELDRVDPLYENLPKVYIRQVVHVPGRVRSVGFRFATDAAGIIGALQFSCRLKGFDQDWGEWQKKGREEYVHLPYGKYVFQVRVRDIFGRIGYSREIRFEIPAPFYLRWYAYGIYVLLFILFVILTIRWRTKRLLLEKARLEKVVELRTVEIRQQRDEIREKSDSLEMTLGQLEQAQDELIRQEKMATVGKLTQGLVDRILNPLNYIGNFALLSENLSVDAVRIVEDEKERIPAEVKEELTEVMEMLRDNLHKIAGHGGSTARILKAMEEILRERKCVLKPVELGTFCRENLEALRGYWEKELNEYKVRLKFKPLNEERMVRIDKEQLGKVLLSILNNGMSALLKKAEKEDFIPLLLLELEDGERCIRIVVKDNGVGIESQVLDKVFDPFFTTRTTAEAAGVGLYLSREVVLNHGGRIGIESEKGVGTEVWIEILVQR